MGHSFFVGPGDREWAEVQVTEPGHGWIQLTWWDAQTDREVSSVFAGRFLGRLVDTVAGMAIQHGTPPVVEVPASRGEPIWMSRRLAAELLPTLVRAVGLAMAGEDRYERVWPGPGMPAPGPLCVYCNLGAAREAVVTICEGCLTDGHVAFARPDTAPYSADHQLPPTSD